MDIFKKIGEIYYSLPKGIYEYAQKEYHLIMSEFYHPEVIILPMTPEGEEIREWLLDYHFDENDNMINQSILRYGCSEINMKYNDELYLLIIINND